MSTSILKGSARMIALVAGIVVQQSLAAAVSDLAAPQKRQAVARLAEQLTRSAAPGDSASVTNPFNPPGFDAPSSEIPNVVPENDRHILESLSARIPSKGTIERGGKMLLSVGSKRIEAGQVLVVADGAKEYEFEVVAITSTTFTLRFRHEEITRPVYSAR